MMPCFKREKELKSIKKHTHKELVDFVKNPFAWKYSLLKEYICVVLYNTGDIYLYSSLPEKSLKKPEFPLRNINNVFLLNDVYCMDYYYDSITVAEYYALQQKVNADYIKDNGKKYFDYKNQLVVKDLDDYFVKHFLKHLKPAAKKKAEEVFEYIYDNNVDKFYEKSYC